MRWQQSEFILKGIYLGLLVFVSFAGILMGILGDKLRGRDVAIGATLAFSLALGSLFLTMSTKLDIGTHSGAKHGETQVCSTRGRHRQLLLPSTVITSRMTGKRQDR